MLVGQTQAAALPVLPLAPLFPPGTAFALELLDDPRRLLDYVTVAVTGGGKANAKAKAKANPVLANPPGLVVLEWAHVLGAHDRRVPIATQAQ